MSSWLPADQKGVAWHMGGPQGTTIAVVNQCMLLGRAGDHWRVGTYMDAATAHSAAVAMTERLEEAGVVLTAGPAMFTTGPDERLTGTRIFAALRIHTDADDTDVASDANML